MPNPFLNSDASLAPDDVLRATGLELSTATQQLYRNSKTLIWVNKPNLFEDLREYAASHGIHDTFVDAATITQLLASRRPQDRAIADRLMTESIMRTAKEISNRTDISDIADGFAKAMAPRNSPDKAQEEIEKLIDAAGPQHPIYQSMRDQYEEIAAKGNLKDPRLVSLRVNMAEIRKKGFDENIDNNSLKINIPQGHLRGKINGTDIESDVIIGEAPKEGGPIKTTPVAKGTIEGMEMQPTWYIPNSIAERKGLMAEIPKLLEEYRRLPPEQQTGTYRFKRMIAGNREPTMFDMNMSLLGNPEVSPFSQVPGPTNPLGAIKVYLGGAFGRQSIRLHDTVASERDTSFKQYAQSSGCIRVKNIAEVAGALAADPNLGQQYGYADNKEFMAAIMKPGAKDQNGISQWDKPEWSHKRIPIQRGIAIQTVYNTVTWDAQNQRAVIHKDIYKRDAASDKGSRNAMPNFQLGIRQAAVTPDDNTAGTKTTPALTPKQATV